MHNWQYPDHGIDDLDAALSEAGKLLGRKGGKASSEAKTAAARRNGQKGGRPPKNTTEEDQHAQD